MVDRRTYIERARDFEKYQIDLIEAEYLSRGFDIVRQQRIPQSQFSADLVAIKPDTQETVIIEIVNLLDGEKLTGRARAITEAYGDAKNVRVDFRFIDRSQTDAINTRKQAAKSARKSQDDLASRLSVQKSQNDPNSTRVAMNDWWLFKRFVRAIAVKIQLDDQAPVLDLYNELLMRNFVKAAEEVDTTILNDAFQIDEEMAIAQEGGILSGRVTMETRLHLLSIRRQYKTLAK